MSEWLKTLVQPYYVMLFRNKNEQTANAHNNLNKPAEPFA